MLTVLNRKYYDVPYTDRDIYVGRGTALGNPFRISETTSRNEAIGKYRKYLAQKIMTKDKFVCGELNRIWKLAKTGDVNLICSCKPDDCHADFIKQLIEEKL